ncbi:MAG TPA: DUF192 domain-containing protein, partial [Steroidobacteraceae bacterium]|nr:DUF192 domain-containing protein [Steroidobacteraceae bacterium]
RRRPALTLAAAVAALLGFAAAVMDGARAQEPRPPLDLASFPRAELQIAHRAANHTVQRFPFTVWIADTRERAEQGLMFVSDLPETMGMVFPLESPRVETMWMKNTYIELDMLFVDAGGRISKITARARPLTLDTLSSDTPVRAVVELRGGVAEKLSLVVGDLVSWKQALAGH